MSDYKHWLSGFEYLGFVPSDSQLTKLLAYKDLLIHWNRTYNLVSRNDQHRVWERHVLDSLSILPHIKGVKVADIGSGAGLPGIPLSIIQHKKIFTLIDRMERKTRFLRHAALSLELENVSVETLNLSDSSTVRCAEAKTIYDTVVARAVSAPNKVWAMARPLLKQGGLLVIQCGLDTEITSQFAGATLIQDVRFTDLNGDPQHRAVVLEKLEGI